MKVKITATITLETELLLEHYDFEDAPKTDDEMIAWELGYAKDNPGDSGLLELLVADGELSDLKIEKLEDAAQAADAA